MSNTLNFGKKPLIKSSQIVYFSHSKTFFEPFFKPFSQGKATSTFLAFFYPWSLSLIHSFHDHKFIWIGCQHEHRILRHSMQPLASTTNLFQLGNLKIKAIEATMIHFAPSISNTYFPLTCLNLSQLCRISIFLTYISWSQFPFTMELFLSSSNSSLWDAAL